jgi:extracellular solute-binding protein (family 5)
VHTRLLHVLLATAFAACRPASPPSALAPAGGGGGRDTTCELAPGPVQSAGTLSVALPGPVDPAHAPVPLNDAERMVFPQLYETLVRVDCAGRVTPSLAETWQAEPDGKRWTFSLRGDAHFWDGAPVTAADVIASWRRGDSLGIRAWNPVALNDREVRLDLPDPADVKRLAASSLAVTKRPPDRGWPIGTARYWISGSTATASPVIQPLGGATGPLAPTIAFRDVSGSDPRDVLDQGIGLLLTDDPAVANYGGSRPGIATLPLLWDRRYVLLVPAGEAPGVERADLVAAVHAEAREDREPWPACAAGNDAAAGRSVTTARRLVYDRSDRTARELAERLVARGVLGGGARVPAVALAPADFAAALRDGSAWAYVAAVPPADPCATAASERGIATLIAVRRYAVVHRGFARLQLDADGSLRIAP